MKKKILRVLLTAIVACAVSVTVSADGFQQADYMGSKDGFEYNIAELSCETYDENGNLVENEISLVGFSISGSTIAPGQTKYYYPSGKPAGFYMEAGRTAAFSASWDKNTTLKIGITSGYAGKYYGKAINIDIPIYTTGNHRLYITNLGNETIVLNGTISY